VLAAWCGCPAAGAWTRGRGKSFIVR